MFKRIKILIYIFVLLLGSSLFFNGFFNEKGDITINSFEYRNKDIKVDMFKLEPIYDKVVFFLIDSLRLDFLNIERNNPINNIHNQMKNINSLMESPKLKNNIRFYNFKSYFPTLTSFRIKAIMTGENPGFSEIISSLNPRSSENIPSILKYLSEQNSTTVIIGDDTWSSIFNKQITHNYKYNSLDIRDFDNLDDFTIDRSNQFLDLSKSHTNYTDWKFLVMHFIGVDHIGHSHGINNEFMKNKLSYLDIHAKDSLLKLLKLNYQNTTTKFVQSIENYIESINYNHSKHEKILFLLFGDHGQTDNGAHGGSKITETSSGLFVFSNVPFNKPMIPPKSWSQKQLNNSNIINFNQRIIDIDEINQIDIVPILSNAFGIPIPKNNLGIFNHDFLINFSDNNLKQCLYSAKIIHNNALQLYKKFLNTPDNNKNFKLKELFLKFQNSYELFKSIHNFDDKLNSQDLNHLLQICNQHLSISSQFAKSLQNHLFKDRACFNWINVFQGSIIILSLLISLFINLVPKINPNFYKFFMEHKLFIISFLTIIFITTINNLMETITFTNQNIPEIFTSYLNSLTCLILFFFVIYVVIKFKMEIKSFYKIIYSLIFQENEFIWSFYWLLLTILCLTQLTSYSAGFIRNEHKVVKFLLASHQIILLFSGLKINLKGIILPIIQLFLIRITYVFYQESDSGILTIVNYNELLIIFVLIMYVCILSILYKNTINNLNVILFIILPIYTYFNWINNIIIVRILASILISYKIYNMIKDYYSKSRNTNINIININNKWITSQLIVIFMLKKELIIPYCISIIIQLIAIENINTRKDYYKDHIIKNIENTVLLYLTSINNFYNLGNRLSLDSVPEYVGLIGLNDYNPLISHLLVIYFLTFHINSLNYLLKLPILEFKNARTLIFAIFLLRFLSTMIGIIILINNHIIWHLLAPKFLYEFVFNVILSIYSLI